MSREAKKIQFEGAADAEPKANKARILVADDDGLYRAIFSDLIAGAGHDSLIVNSALELLEKVTDYQPDLIISDVVMPGMNGFDLVTRLKKDPLTMHIPVIIVTSLADRDSKVTGLARGADELLSKPIDEAEFGIRISNLLKVKKFGDYLQAHGKKLEGMVETKSVELEKALKKIRSGYIEAVYRLTLAAEYRDKQTGGHIKRISLYSQLIARSLNLPEVEAEAIFFASPMHDVGKIGIPDSILLKPGKFNEEEFETMKLHSVIGGEILSGSDSDIINTAHEVALTHHEMWDGSGYPYGLQGTEIPISGRIVSITDIYDALRSARPYKDPFDHKKACDIIDGMNGRFDPTVYNAFKECAGEFNRLFKENQKKSELDFL